MGRHVRYVINEYKILVGKPEGKTQFGRSKHRQE